MEFFKSFWKLFNSTPRHQYRPSKVKRKKYDGARYTPVTKEWLATNSSADTEIYSSIKTLRNRSRDLCRNNDYARGIINTFVKNIILTGIKLQAQIPKIKGNGLNEELNQAIEDAWLDWGNDCDVTGYGDFNSLQQLIIRSFVESGEVFIRKIKKKSGESKIPFSLEVIECDQVADDAVSRGIAADNEIRMGVEIDRWGKPLAYWMFQNHPGDNYFKSITANRYLTRVPAEEIIHIYLKERPGQTRGVPWLYSSILRLRNLNQYEQSEQIAARAAANIAALVTTQDADLIDEPEPQTITNEQGEEIIIEQEEIKESESIEPGALMYLSPGETVHSFSPNRPNSALPEFNAHMIRGISVGTGISYETASKDYSRSNYSSSRLALLESRDQWRILQAWFMKNFLAEVYKDWLDMAVLAGEVKISGNYELNPKFYRKVKWIGRGWEWVDPDKETKAIEKALRLGLTSRMQQAAKNGYDFEEICKDKRKEQELMTKYGVKFQ